jgi:nucleotide-binding universal stress UspA family protein
LIEIRRILCPTDFSEASKHALDHAAALARWYECRVTVLYVHSPMIMSTLGPDIPLLQSAVLTPEDRQALLRNLREFAAAEIGEHIAVDAMVSEGEAAAEIVAAAQESNCDLIVLGTHGRSGLEHLTMGSVTEKVLRKARRPVMTVPPRAPDMVPVPSALFRRVLCAIDFSPPSMQALDYACAIAQEAGGQLAVLHSVEFLPGDSGSGASWATQTVANYFEQARAESESRLSAVIPPEVRDYCEVETVMTAGTPYREILREAESRQSDLIVLGVHGRNPIDVMLFGSTVYQVLRRARCPVLTVGGVSSA